LRPLTPRAAYRLGTLRSLWAQAGRAPVQFLGVRTAGTAGRGLLVPAEGIEVDPTRRSVRLPYAAALVEEAPAYAPGAELTPERKGEIYRHYDLHAMPCPQLSTLCCRD
jgi:hypothetical protein